VVRHVYTECVGNIFFGTLWNTCAKRVYGKNVIESFLKDIVHYKCHVKEYTVFAHVICAP
jgi:hypothetical protein